MHVIIDSPLYDDSIEFDQRTNLSNHESSRDYFHFLAFMLVLHEVQKFNAVVHCKCLLISKNL